MRGPGGGGGRRGRRLGDADVVELVREHVHGLRVPGEEVRDAPGVAQAADRVQLDGVHEVAELVAVPHEEDLPPGARARSKHKGPSFRSGARHMQPGSLSGHRAVDAAQWQDAAAVARTLDGSPAHVAGGCGHGGTACMHVLRSDVISPGGLAGQPDAHLSGR